MSLFDAASLFARNTSIEAWFDESLGELANDAVTGSVSQTLASVTGASAGAVRVAGAVTHALTDVASTSAGAVRVAAAVALELPRMRVTIDDLTDRTRGT